MDIFDLLAEDEDCLFCEGKCICWAHKLHPGSPVFVQENIWAVIQSVDHENNTVILFAKELNVSRQEVAMINLTKIC